MISQYFAPTKVIFGQGAENEVGTQLEAFGAKRVLLVYGGHSAEKSGLLGKVRNILNERDMYFCELGGVKPNPRISLAREGVKKYAEEKLDFILAVGGGSVIDTAKAIGYGAFSNCDPWDFYCGKEVPSGSAPVGVILTMAAAGSEMSDSSVLTNEEGGLKRGCNSDYCRVKFALMNPELTYTVPDYQTSCGTVDIIMHTLERYFHAGKGLDFTDDLSFALIRSVIENGKVLHKDPENYDARANVMWASSLSHNGLMATGNPSKGDWACHQLEHELSGMFDIAHGAGLAIVFPAWASYVASTDYSRFAKLGKNVFGIEGKDEKEAAEKTIESFKKFFASLGMPVSLSEINITLSEENLSELLDKATFYGKRTLGNFRVLQREDMEAVYRRCQ